MATAVHANIQKAIKKINMFNWLLTRTLETQVEESLSVPPTNGSFHTNRQLKLPGNSPSFFSAFPFRLHRHNYLSLCALFSTWISPASVMSRILLWFLCAACIFRCSIAPSLFFKNAKANSGWKFCQAMSVGCILSEWKELLPERVKRQLERDSFNTRAAYSVLKFRKPGSAMGNKIVPCFDNFLVIGKSCVIQLCHSNFHPQISSNDSGRI